ncbi:hypothetical protein MKC70_08805 [[Clostridium] innocuum]|nr:hypothetical protein [[Clostridium] innocuum]MDU1119859.1 hypothetical protein [Erysipelotrichaceae bacterium]
MKQTRGDFLLPCYYDQTDLVASLPAYRTLDFFLSQGSVSDCAGAAPSLYCFVLLKCQGICVGLHSILAINECSMSPFVLQPVGGRSL